MDNWLVAAREDWVTPVRLSSLVVTAPVLRRRMVVHLPEGAGKIKLVGETELIADVLDGQISGVEQLHRALHAEMVQVAQGGIDRHAPKRSRVVRLRQIHEGRQRRH